jgi:hypothetical protein
VKSNCAGWKLVGVEMKLRWVLVMTAVSGRGDCVTLNGKRLGSAVAHLEVENASVR